MFPGVVIPITAGRDKSIKLLNDAYNSKQSIGVVAQKDAKVEDPNPSEIHQTGTVARILRVLKMPDGNTTVIIQGQKKFVINEVIKQEPYLVASVTEMPEERPDKNDKEFAAVVDSIKELSLKIIEDSPVIPTEASFAIKNIESSSFLINFISSNMNLSVAQKQELLEIKQLSERALVTLKHMTLEHQKLSLKNDIQDKVRTDLDKQQRDYFLQQQMKTIQEELGGVSHEAEIAEMRAKAKKKKWNEKIAKHFDKELAKMSRINPNAPEFGIQRNYL